MCYFKIEKIGFASKLIYQKNDAPPRLKSRGLWQALVFWMHENSSCVVEFSAQRIAESGNSLVLGKPPHHKWCGFLEASQHNNALEIYKVFKVIKKEFNEILINNFNLIKKGQIISCSGEKEQFAEEDFTAVLVNEESYKDVLCLACKKVFCQSL